MKIFKFWKNMGNPHYMISQFSYQLSGWYATSKNQGKMQPASQISFKTSQRARFREVAVRNGKYKM
jgi:hypothetical protein